MHRSNVLQSLRERLASHEPTPHRGPVGTFAIPLRAGAIHEWLGGDDPRSWTPPLCVLIDLARRAATPPVTDERSDSPNQPGLIVWVGRRCHPHPHTLIARPSQHPDDGLLRRSLFIDPPDTPSRLWAIDTALRSPSVAVVVADASSLDMAATRRLQLAAESRGSVALLARPLSELKHLSAATTRWVIRPDPDSTHARHPRWTIELVRSKGLTQIGSTDDASARTASWRMEWDHDARTLVASPLVEHRTGQAPTPPTHTIRLTG